MERNSKESANTIELQIKRKFAEKQQMLREYLEDVERLPLHAIIPDPLRVHSLEEYKAAIEEEKMFQKIKRVLNRLARMKKHNVDMERLFHILRKDKQVVKKKHTKNSGTKNTKYKDNLEDGMFPLNRTNSLDEQERQELFKADMDMLKELPRMELELPQVNRNLSASSSHTQFIKKMEREELGSPTQPKTQPETVKSTTESKKQVQTPENEKTTTEIEKTTENEKTNTKTQPSEITKRMSFRNGGVLSVEDAKEESSETNNTTERESGSSSSVKQ